MPKDSVTKEAHKSLKSKSIFRLDNNALAKYQKEHKQNMFKSAYGLAFGRKETDLADTGILQYKKFSELQCWKVLNKTARAYITRWSNLGEDGNYSSLAILAVKGIFTFWKQSLPSDTMSHLKHAWYDPHDVVHQQRMDTVGKEFLMSRISRATAKSRPQTTSNLLRRRNQNLIPSKKNDDEQGMDQIIEDRKKFLLRGNGNITSFYNDPEGIVSSYQQQFKTWKSTKTIQRTAGTNYVSSVMVITPDPSSIIKQGQKQERFK